MKFKSIAMLSLPAIFLAGTFGSLQVQAQDNDHKKGHRYEQGNKGEHSERMLKRLSKKLDLTEQQQTDLKALFDNKKEASEGKHASRQALHDAVRNLDPSAADYASKLAQVKQQAGLAAQNKIDNMMEMRQSLQSILTPEQFTKMQAFKEKRSEHGKRGKHGKRGENSEQNG
jgi:Spy/CpxP family protein refolding chaperone